MRTNNSLTLLLEELHVNSLLMRSMLRTPSDAPSLSLLQAGEGVVHFQALFTKKLGELLKHTAGTATWFHFDCPRNLVAPVFMIIDSEQERYCANDFKHEQFRMSLWSS